MLTVTFDSNVWRSIVTPWRFPQDPARVALDKILSAIVDKRARGFLSETAFTLEAIKRVDRKSTFVNHRPSIKLEDQIVGDGIKISFSIGPDPTQHFVTRPVLQAHLQDAINLGFRVLRVPRLGGIKNRDLSEWYYAEESPDGVMARHERMGKLLQEIEAKGWGIAHAKVVAGPPSKNGPWVEGLKNLHPTDEKRFASAVAEWADGDSVAAHYAYENDIFCTRDMGKAGGRSSILFPANRAWLTASFGINFGTPEDIVSRL